MCVCASLCVYMYVCACASLSVCMCIFVCLHMSMCKCVHVCLCMCVSVCMSVCTCVSMCVYIQGVHVYRGQRSTSGLPWLLSALSFETKALSEPVAH